VSFGRGPALLSETVGATASDAAKGSVDLAEVKEKTRSALPSEGIS
jgi:hypothetical protein